MQKLTAKEVGEKLVQHCRNGTEKQGLDELYHDNAVSAESIPNPQTGDREVLGIAAIKAKHEWWDGQVEMTDSKIEGPMPHGDNKFAVIFEAKGKSRENGDTFDMREVGVYHVENGKITREEFYYAM